MWQVQNTAQAVFDVENFEHYVKIQSESALRHMANGYAYDHGEEHEITLRSGVDEVSLALRDELQQRLSKAGVHVEEARLTREERDLVRRRDWRALIHYGVIFFLLEKLAAVVGITNLHVYAAMRGETLEEFQKTRNVQILYSVAGQDAQAKQ